MSKLKQSITKLFKVVKSREKCIKHDYNLIICTFAACNTCSFKKVCKNKMFCGKCVDELKEGFAEANEVIRQDELLPILKDLDKMGKLADELADKLDNFTETYSRTYQSINERYGQVKNRIKDLKEKKNKVKAKLK